MHLSSNPLIDIAIDRDATIRARGTYGGGAIVARFESPVTLYRVLDGEELTRIVETGEVSGGMFALPGERAYGACWSITVEELPSWGRAWSGRRRIGKDLFVAKFDAEQFTFFHLGPDGVPFRPDGPPKQRVQMEGEECDTGLGCAVRAPASSVEFFKVAKDNSLKPMTAAQVEAYAAKHPVPEVALRSLGGPHAFGGTILGHSVLVVQDQYDMLWAVEDRHGRPFIMGGKTKKQAIQRALDYLQFGVIPPLVDYLNRRPAGFEFVQPGQVWQTDRVRYPDRLHITEVGASYVRGNRLDRSSWSGSHATIDAKSFMREMRQVS